MIRQKIEHIREKINQVCQRIGRNPDEITILGVTKYSPIEKIQEALSCGITHIAENKVQDAQQKFSALDPFIQASSLNVTKHMIGHLQTNKVKVAVNIFDVIQSVDSLKLIQEIEKHAANSAKTMNIFIEVNTGGEEQKDGVPKDGALSLIEAALSCTRLRVLGLMTMAPLVEDQGIIRRCFQDLRQLGDSARLKFKGHSRFDLKYLSMGMTHDFEIALEEGSNMLRIGRAIFE